MSNLNGTTTSGSAISLVIEGYDELVTALEAAPTEIEDAMLEASLDVWDLLRPELMVYPPPLSGSKYNRTGNLASGWNEAIPNITPLESGFQMDVTNSVAYWVYVQSASMQAHWNAGRWATDEMILNSKQGEIETLFANKLAEITQKFGIR